MGVASYLEFVTTLFAWIMYKNLWAVLVDTGLVFLPIITMMVGNIMESRKGGDDEGSAGIQSLKKIETDFYMMFFVMVFAAIPMVDVKLGEMTYVRPVLSCTAHAETISGSKTGTTYDKALQTLGGESGQAPLWWAVLHIVSKAVTSASIAGIPCSYDLASVEYKLASDVIESPDLRRDVLEFTDDCYRASKAKLMRSHTAVLTSEELNDTMWLGSKYFQRNHGYYDTFYSYNAQPDYPFDPVRDSGFESDAITGGHPVCNEWWANNTKGIRERVLRSIDFVLLGEMVYVDGGLISKATTQSLSVTEREDVFLRKYLAMMQVKNAVGVRLPMSTGYNVSLTENGMDQAQNGGWLRSTYGSITMPMRMLGDMGTTAMVAAGAALKIPSTIAEGQAIRQGISMIQCFVLMLLVMMLPFLMVFSEYKASTLMTLSVIFFAVHFLSFIWAVAFWFDNNLMSILTLSDGLGIFAPVANPVQSMTILYIKRFLYLFFPAIFLASLGWAGIKAGNLGEQIASFGTNAGAPGKAGGAAVESAAKSGATGGKL